ncbi:sensor domain-containing diguanylate cyclase [Vibrio sp. 10N]|uniref:sensor domain-containing diguanylate cyclase n=1 Tax=Vibrio sp. 10N TaxID=3058938 RepID=UPI0028147A9D|nr:hypothetical protein VB10N_18400 [Vibrio sp. 10N]
MDKPFARLDESISRLFDVTPIPTAITCPDGQLIYANPALCRFLGYSPAELMSNDIVMTHPNDLELNRRIRSQLSHNPHMPIQLEKRYIHKNGHTLIAQLNIAADVSALGKVQHFVSQIVDLSATRKSHATELLLTQMVEKSSDAIYVVGIEYGQILNCNELAYKRLGYSKEELLQLTVTDINPRFSKETTWSEHVRRMRQAGEACIEATHKRKDGTELPIEASVNMVEFAGQQYLLAIVRDISERKEKELKAIEAQNLDPLTNLPNRRLLESQLKRLARECRKRSEKVAFMYVDIDDFKSLNDRHGHLAGDKVLVEFAKRLQDFTRQSDLVGRLGGDEFLVVLPGMKNRAHVLSIAQHILQVTSHPIDVGTQMPIQINVSLGTTLCDSEGLDCTRAVSVADKAMYQAKAQVGSACHFLDLNQE